MNEKNARAFVLGYEAGEAAEQERIIKLLLERSNATSKETLIALIKREQNPHVRAETDVIKVEKVEIPLESVRTCGCKGKH